MQVCVTPLRAKAQYYTELCDFKQGKETGCLTATLSLYSNEMFRLISLLWKF